MLQLSRYVNSSPRLVGYSNATTFRNTKSLSHIVNVYWPRNWLGNTRPSDALMMKMRKRPQRTRNNFERVMIKSDAYFAYNEASQ